MNGTALVGILLVAYAAVVVYIAAAKPEAMWNMAKIKMFRKLLGETGTVVFFYVFAAAAAGFGGWLMTK